MMPKLFRYAYKSAVTGKFVTYEYARLHPAETFRARLWFWQKAP